LQTLYMAAKLQQQGEELSDPLKQKNVIAKTAIEGRLFAKDPTQPQSEIAKQAATLTKKYQHEAKGYPEEQRDLYFMVRSCKGHENIGLQMHHAEKMQQDLQKITRYVIDKYVEKQEQLYQQKAKEMGGHER